MQKIMFASAALAFVLNGIEVDGKLLAKKQSFLEPDGDSDGLVKPLKFNQQLLACNAYPNKSPISVVKNEHESLIGKGDALPFGECRYLQSKVLKGDQLDFGLRDTDVKGTFEVGELPVNDAILLVVIGKREKSQSVSFQSFAFPSAAGRQEANIAVVNTFVGNSSDPKLLIEEHSSKNIQTPSKRMEQLAFNRIYSVDEGDYDASISDIHRDSLSAGQELTRKKTVRLSKNQNYVVLRVGGGEYDESLIVYPSENPSESGAKQTLIRWCRAIFPKSFVKLFGA